MNSLATIERGLAENILLRCKSLVERETGFKCNMTAWYATRHASWNVSLSYNVSKSAPSDVSGKSVVDAGKGFDFHDAAISLRTNLLQDRSQRYDVSFANLAEFEDYLDKRDNVTRNDLGAETVEASKEDLAAQVDSLLHRLVELEATLNSILLTQ
jgi:hypothetical protein